MARHLLVAVHLYADGMGVARYHGMSQGAPEWPPSPARVFQALVAGAARGQHLPPDVGQALAWLEQLQPPVIAAPLHTSGQALAMYVPNNDADALADPSDVSSIRTAKQVQPSLFDGSLPVLYAWAMPSETPPLQPLMEAVHALYQLGRGLDMAWADVQVLDDGVIQDRLSRWRGVVHRPDATGAGLRTLACPVPGSLASLESRHGTPRLRVEGAGKKARVLFTNPPKPRFASVNYTPVHRRHLYDLRERGTSKSWPWALHHAAALVVQLRDAATARLQAALGPGAAEAIARSLVGKAPDGSGAVPAAQRVRIVPLPSIGSVHADQAIRRVMVEVPGGCPLSADDLDWAFSGLDATDPETGELSPWLLAQADDLGMLDHFAKASRHWQTVTAVALPDGARRRRADPAQPHAQAQGAAERQAEERRAVAAVRAALRHAGVLAGIDHVHVQREPFAGHGRRAEAFAGGSRFEKGRLWHVALGFDRLVAGPLTIGDGRFLGLGVLAPADALQGVAMDPGTRFEVQTDGVIALKPLDSARTGPVDPMALSRALRRAVMARVRDELGLSPTAGLPRYFSGHLDDVPAKDTDPARHLAFHWDSPRNRWLVLAPHRLQRRPATRWEQEHLATLSRALDGLTTLQAGSQGLFAVQRVDLSDADAVLAPAQVWRSVTDHAVTRHRRLASAADALAADVLAECRRTQLPAPSVRVVQTHTVRGRGLQGVVELRFSTAVAGPMALGRTGLLGGGLFEGVSSGQPDH